MNYIGIDPGAFGAMAILSDTCQIKEFKHEGIRGYAETLHSLGETGPFKLYLEKVHSMPGQGVASMFSFGQRLGEIEGMLQTMNITYTTVRPQEWRKACGIPPKSTKVEVAGIIQQLHPDAPLYGPRGGLKDGVADAIGIAYYGLTKDLNARTT